MFVFIINRKANMNRSGIINRIIDHLHNIVMLPVQSVTIKLGSYKSTKRGLEIFSGKKI